MVKYGKECKTDANCGSGICEMTYNDAGQAKGRFCVIQEPTYGKKCKYNKDCVSNRCVHTYSEQGDHQGRRCAVVKGMVIPKRGWPFDDDGVPDILKASNYVEIIEDRQNQKIACLEEIAFKKKWINKKDLKSRINYYGKSEYSDYLKEILNDAD